jgi:hypothetical protein
MPVTIKETIGADCGVLLFRALLNKSVSAFGEDGLGKYGKSDHPRFFDIADLDIDIAIDESGIPEGMLFINLADYDYQDVGHIATDRNFLICIREMLKAEHIDPECLSYSALDEQGENFVSMDIDIALLLDWA